jgi:hypothetical protein
MQISETIIKLHMLTSSTIGFHILVSIFVVLVELFYILRRGWLRPFIDRYLLYFFLSIVLALFSEISCYLQSRIDDTYFVIVVFLYAFAALMGTIATFLLGKYIALRSIILLFRAIFSNEQHPAYLTLKRTISSRGAVNFLALFIAILVNIPLILTSLLGLVMLLFQ